jgi:hypothetical protein
MRRYDHPNEGLRDARHQALDISRCLRLDKSAREKTNLNARVHAAVNYLLQRFPQEAAHRFCERRRRRCAAIDATRKVNSEFCSSAPRE